MQTIKLRDLTQTISFQDSSERRRAKERLIRERVEVVEVQVVCQEERSLRRVLQVLSRVVRVVAKGLILHARITKEIMSPQLCRMNSKGRLLKWQSNNMGLNIFRSY
jgi:hypothetical protein